MENQACRQRKGTERDEWIDKVVHSTSPRKADGPRCVVH